MPVVRSQPRFGLNTERRLQMWTNKTQKRNRVQIKECGWSYKK